MVRLVFKVSAKLEFIFVLACIFVINDVIINFFEEKEILNRIFEKYSDKTIIYISHKKEIIDMFYEKYKLERRNRS